MVEEITRREPYLNKQDIKQGLDILLNFVTQSLCEKKRMEIRGFGSFSVAHRAASTGRNPRTGEVIQIAASKQPKFRAGAPLKASVNS